MFIQKDTSAIEVLPPIQTGYIIPFDIEDNQIEISQGYNGPYSHFPMIYLDKYKSDKRFCVDFKLPFGTNVLNSKKGKVTFLGNNSLSYYDGKDINIGAKTPVNFVCIKHENGLISLYQHLSQEGFNVKKDDVVKKGQVIAKTGKSGWIGSVPHLHYELYSLKKGHKKTFPVKFDNYNGVLEHSLLFFKN